TVNCQENKLTSLDFSKNPKFNYLYAHTNKLTSLNLKANPNLNYLNCANSLLENLDLSNNKSIMYLFCEGNRFKTLDVSNQTSLSQFGCDNNLLTSINVSKNTYMSHFSCSGNQLTVLDLSSNSNLWTLYCKENKLTTLNVSKNKKLEYINCSSNNLVSLNIKNGNNVNFEGLDNDYSIDFRNNPNLTCIQVDDITFANEKMASKKDATATYNTNCGSTLVLPNDNFTVETKGESCLGENNGEINVTAQATYVYEAIISGKTYPFTNNSLKVASLAPGNYTISVTIPDENFEQNFNFTIVKAATTTGKSSITSKKVDIEITEGTAPFTVSIDGTEQFQTNNSIFSIELKEGGLIEVATAKACEGIYSKKVQTADILGTILSAHPNPTTGIFEIEVPTNKNEVVIELYNFGGQLISSKNYVIENGTAKLTLENQPSGIYAAKIYLEKPEYIKIIKK
ncbi:MAG: T9SS type A sorting domain-containing protein, partial [Flavobacterium sp.]